ncbi:hypothetical protein PGN35_009930 [Nodosilinea sp. PGN35]|uniref:hypothetical protein n=1 Tax=Nodosilinea sp. PGN35 TaxID=3020489 RepID=UPI0023B3288E|nr:hypothetical protein [Nodosilinea sp. TSF1-S3]MDF0366651.1 hypothetical protein [Nodosilinea sp. TSF1-S3]
MLNDSESSSTLWATVHDVAFQVLQVIDIRLALLIGLAAFMLAVGFDSSGNQAEAADLINRSSLVPVRVAPVSPSSSSYSLAGESSVGDAQLAMARRLHHGGLTSPIITNNRLTDAHFFTELPSRQ